MSGPARFHSLGHVLAGRWQVPLLLVSLVSFGLGLWQFYPDLPPPTFEERLAEVEHYFGLRMGDVAQALGRVLLQDPSLTDEQRAQVHRTIAEGLYAQIKRDPGGVTDALLESAAAQYLHIRQLGLPLAPEEWARLSELWGELARPEMAAQALERALASGLEESFEVYRRLFELRAEQVDRDPESLDRLLEEMLRRWRLGPEDLLWLAEHRLQLLHEMGRLEEADAFLASLESGFAGTRVEGAYQYLRAVIDVMARRFDEAERRARLALGLGPAGTETESRARWLLGQIALRDDRPQEALEEFRLIARAHLGGPFRLGGLIGEAAALRALERWEELERAYEEIIEFLETSGGGRLRDANFLGTWWLSDAGTLAQQGELTALLPLLRLIDAWVSGDPKRLLAIYYGRMAELKVRLADGLRAEAGAQPDGAVRERIRRLEAEAARADLRLAEVAPPDSRLARDAVFHAATRYEAAGLLREAVRTYRRFVDSWPADELTPQAMANLGALLVRSGNYPGAIGVWEDLLRRFPRSEFTFRSIVPLAEAWMEMGPEGYDDAERTLNLVLDPPEEWARVFTPRALTYRDALFTAGNLYLRMGEPERAIARLEEAIGRYPDDPRAIWARLQLGRAYRESAEALRAALDDPQLAAQRRTIRTTIAQRLARADALFDEIIRRLTEQDGSLDERQATYLKLCYFYRADWAFDTGDYERAARLYEQVVWDFPEDPAALSALVRMITCYLNLGRWQDARAALMRARQLAEHIPAARFRPYGIGPDREFWIDYFRWLSESVLFARSRPAA